MCKKITSGVTLLTILACFAAHVVAEQLVFDIPRLENITIDGHLDDWAEQGLRVDMLHPLAADLVPIDDLNAKLRIAWNDQGVLVLLIVTDDVWLEHESDAMLWAADSIEMWLSLGDDIPDKCQWAITPGVDDKHDAIRWKIYDARRDELKQGSAQPVIERTKIDGGYIMEALLPWSTLSIKPTLGQQVAIQVRINDQDDPGGDTYRAGWHPSFQTFWGPAHMHRIRLAEKAGVGQPVVYIKEYNQQDLQAVVTARALPIQVGQTLIINNGDQEIARGEFSIGPHGYAQAKVALPLTKSSDAYQQLELQLKGQSVAKVQLPYSGCLANIQSMIQQEESLIQKYALDQPWNNMPDASPAVKRNRGLVAWALMAIHSSNTPDNANRLESLALAAKIIAAINNDDNYLAKQRNEFWSACFSTADGSGQPFITAVPPDYDSQKSYPLMLRVHGGAGLRMPITDQPYTEPCLTVRPWSRSSYRALDEVEIMQIIDYMKKYYNIDPDRVYINGGYYGGYYGGWGTWTLATRNADTFAAAAPVYGSANYLPFENLANLPILNQHGTIDWVVPLDQSRYAVASIQKLGYPVIHIEYPGKGHEDLGGINLEDWLFAQRRPQSPPRVALNCQTPEEGKSFWLDVRKFTDPHARVIIDATITGYGQQQSLSIRDENAAVLTLDVTSMPLDRSQSLHLQINTTYLNVPQPLPEKLHIVKNNDTYTLQPNWTPPQSDIRPYRPGATANLYTGEPLLIVYGTQADEARKQFWQQVAQRIASNIGTDWPMTLGRFPVKPDHQVTDQDIAHYNLVLLGNEIENTITARIASQLPITINESNELIAGARQPVSLDQATYRLTCYNPLSHKRLVFLIYMDNTSAEKAMKWVTQDRGVMVGWKGIRRGDQPDLCVQTLDGNDRLLMQFTDDWQWRILDGADQKASADKASNEFVAQAILQVIRQAAAADFAMGYPPRKDWYIRNYDFNYITRADMAIETLDHPTITGSVTGEQLIEIHKLFINKNKITVYPKFEPNDIDPQKIYSLAMPLDLIWELKPRHKNLRNARPGPRWKKENLLEEIFDR